MRARAFAGVAVGVGCVVTGLLAAPLLGGSTKPENQKRKTSMSVSGSGRPVSTLNLHAAPLSLRDGAVGVDNLALVEDRGSPGLLASTGDGAGAATVLHLYRPGAAASPPGSALTAEATFTLPASLSPPQWTAAISGAPAPASPAASVVLSQPGSAMSPLVFWRSGTSQIEPVTPKGLRVFSAPRLVRHEASALVVAIEGEERGDRVVLLSAGAPGAPAWTERLLSTPEGGRLGAAVLVRRAEGYILVFTTPVTAGDRGARTRARPPFGTVSLGAIHVLPLDRGFAPAGKAAPLQGAEPVYELDADVDGDRLLILGTTRAGYEVAVARFTGPSLEVVARGQEHLSSPAVAPTVLALGGAGSFALLQPAHNTSPARILQGRL